MGKVSVPAKQSLCNFWQPLITPTIKVWNPSSLFKISIHGLHFFLLVNSIDNIYCHNQELTKFWDLNSYQHHMGNSITIQLCSQFSLLYVHYYQHHNCSLQDFSIKLNTLWNSTKGLHALKFETVKIPFQKKKKHIYTVKDFITST